MGIFVPSKLRRSAIESGTFGHCATASFTDPSCGNARCQMWEEESGEIDIYIYIDVYMYYIYLPGS